MYADLPRGDVAQLQSYVDLPFELARGRGGLRLWLDFQTNGWRGLTADVDLRDVDLRLSRKVATIALAQASGRLVAARTSAGVSFGAEHFGFETADGVVWPKGDIHVGWDQRQTLLKSAQAMPVRDARASGPEAPSSGPSSARTSWATIVRPSRRADATLGPRLSTLYVPAMLVAPAFVQSCRTVKPAPSASRSA